MTTEEANELIERLPYITVITAPREKDRFCFYEAALKTENTVEWARVVKTCWLRGHDIRGNELSISVKETEYGRNAAKRLNARLSSALGISENEVDGYIEKYLADNL